MWRKEEKKAQEKFIDSARLRLVSCLQKLTAQPRTEANFSWLSFQYFTINLIVVISFLRPSSSSLSHNSIKLIQLAKWRKEWNEIEKIVICLGICCLAISSILFVSSISSLFSHSSPYYRPIEWRVPVMLRLTAEERREVKVNRIRWKTVDDDSERNLVCFGVGTFRKTSRTAATWRGGENSKWKKRSSKVSVCLIFDLLLRLEKFGRVFFHDHPQRASSKANQTLNILEEILNFFI